MAGLDFVFSNPRKRYRETSVHKSHYKYGAGGSWSRDKDTTFVESEETHDELNNWHRVQAANRRNAGNRPGEGKPLPLKGDYGGGFYHLKTSYDEDVKSISYFAPNWATSGPAHVGTIYPFADSIDKNDSVYIIPSEFRPSSISTLLSQGATAISRCAPTNPHADVAVGLAELYREGLPHIPAWQTVKGKRPEGEYLNYEFGLKPLISDLKNAHKAMKKSRSILGQYYRDSGRLVRRSYSFEPKISSESVFRTGSTAAPINVGPSTVWESLSAFHKTTFTTYHQRTWFKGGFVYHAQKHDDLVLDKLEQLIQQANILYGLDFNVSVMWNLAPWSWLADWLTNIGDVLNNVAMIQNDGLFMRYGYVMQTTSKEVNCVGRNYRTKDGQVADGSQMFKVEYKLRRRATPFGFGLDPSNFTTRQWALLAAVGISQGRGHL